MKWLAILKDKTGKFVMTTQNALIFSTAVAVGVSTVAYNVGSTQAREELKVRSFSSISDQHDYGGMILTADGQMTSMQIRDGLNQVATREERERMQGGGGSSNDFGLNAADGIDGRVSGGYSGYAAQTGATEGLGMGANVGVEVGSGNASVNPYGGAQGGDGYSRGSVQIPGQGGRGDPQGSSPAGSAQLPSASMATATGSAFSTASGAIGGSSGSGSTRSGSGRGGSEGYKFTGSMPESSSAVASLTESGKADSRNPSRFLASGRHSYIDRKQTRPETGKDIKDIAKRSADAAKNKNKSNTEGARAFLAASQDSAGMTFENGESNEQTGSADFDTNDNAINNLNNWQNNSNKENEQRTKDRKALLVFLLSTIGAAAVIIPMAAWLISCKTLVFLKALGYALLGMLALLAGYLVYRAGDYSATYHSTWFPLISILAGVGVAGLAVFTMVKPELVHDKLMKWKASIMKSIWTHIGMPMATTTVQSGINSDK